MVSATVQTDPAQINLTWLQDSSAVPTSYEISRKLATERTWTVLSTLSGNETSFVDQTVTANTKYEYQIKKAAVGYIGYGYVMAGSEIPLREDRGKLILIVDNTYADDLTNELSRLQQDLIGDGWQVIRHDVNRNDTPVEVKNLIKADYDADPANVRSVFLFGHVPVPYSGDIVPDGHNPNHRGAWPADVYYADIDYTWGDATITSTNATDPRQHNRPGDGKFDFSVATMVADLEVGRVDLANLPQFALSEKGLLRQYLDKDHNFRHKKISAKPQGLVADFFGVFNGSAFAATGWRNFAPFFGGSNVVSTTDWFGSLTNDTYLTAYGCGGGTFTSVDGVATTAQLSTRDPGAVFTFLFGSYFGDWDTTNNVMRATLATPTYTLTSAWAGRPHWFVHHMGLGETIGHSARLTQINNSSASYRQINPGSQQIHIALMGDPTLRLHPVAPPTSPLAQAGGTQVALSWTESVEPVLGYHVYRATNAAGPFTRVSSELVATNEFTDTGLTSGDYTYMVRAVRLEVSASGSYYNASQGAFVNASLNDARPIDIVPVPDQIVELGANWNFATPEVSGGCAPVSVNELYTTTNAACGNTFQATRVWTATDACNSSHFITNAVTVVDTTAPTFAASADKSIELGGAWTFDLPTASDLGGTATITVVGTTTNVNPGGSVTATCIWQATDPCGNSAQVSQSVVISDTTAPVLSQIADATVELGTDWNFDLPTATDASGSVVVTVLNTATNAGLGNTFSAVRTWLATDASGNTALTSQTVSVVDTTAPVLSQPGNLTVELGTDWDFDLPTATDASGAVTITVLETSTNAGFGNTFVAIRTWLATDASGNTTQTSQTVSVVDTTAPSIAPLPGKVVELGSSWTFDAPSVSDIGGSVTVNVISVQTNATEKALVLSCTWLATDASGNASEVSQNVSVVDTAAPMFFQPDNKTVELGNFWMFDEPLATDLSGQVIISVVSTITNSAHGAALTATRTWSATDASGNAAEISQIVTILDTTSPTMTAPKDKTVIEGTEWTFDTPTATDASGEVTITILNITTNGNASSCVVTCTWLATDASGNSSQCSQSVTIEPAGPVVVGIAALSEFAYEGGDLALFEITRTGSATKSVTLKLQYAGAAQCGLDFTGMPAEVIIPAGANSVILTLNAESDSLIEKSEAVTVSIRGGEGYESVSSSSATISLFDTTQKRKSDGLIRPGRP